MNRFEFNKGQKKPQIALTGEIYRVSKKMRLKGSDGKYQTIYPGQIIGVTSHTATDLVLEVLSDPPKKKKRKKK